MKVLIERLAERGRDGRWIPFAFAGFFLVVFAANGIMTLLATTTWPGLVEGDYYRSGVAYNRNLEAAEAQQRLGWQADLAVERPGDDRLTLRLALADAGGAALAVERVEAAFRRPAQADLDFARTFTAVGAGRYEMTAEMPAPGLWEVHVTATRGAQRYQISRRVSVRP